MWGDIGNAISGVAQDAVGTVSGAAQDAVGSVSGVAQDAIGSVSGAAQDAVGTVSGAAQDAAGVAQDAAGTVYGVAQDAAGVAQDAAGTATGAIQDSGNFLMNTANDLKNTANARAMDIATVQQLMPRISLEEAQKIINGEGPDSIWQRMVLAQQSATDAANPFASTMVEGTQQAANTVAEGSKQAANAVQAAVDPGARTIVAEVGKAALNGTNVAGASLSQALNTTAGFVLNTVPQKREGEQHKCVYPGLPQKACGIAVVPNFAFKPIDTFTDVEMISLLIFSARDAAVPLESILLMYRNVIDNKADNTDKDFVEWVRTRFNLTNSSTEGIYSVLLDRHNIIKLNDDGVKVAEIVRVFILSKDWETDWKKWMASVLAIGEGGNATEADIQAVKTVFTYAGVPFDELAKLLPRLKRIEQKRQAENTDWSKDVDDKVHTKLKQFLIEPNSYYDGIVTQTGKDEQREEFADAPPAYTYTDTEQAREEFTQKYTVTINQPSLSFLSPSSPGVFGSIRNAYNSYGVVGKVMLILSLIAFVIALIIIILRLFTMEGRQYATLAAVSIVLLIAVLSFSYAYLI
jgi:hypothetical protein